MKRHVAITASISVHLCAIIQTMITGLANADARLKCIHLRRYKIGWFQSSHIIAMALGFFAVGQFAIQNG